MAMKAHSNVITSMGTLNIVHIVLIVDMKGTIDDDDDFDILCNDLKVFHDQKSNFDRNFFRFFEFLNFNDEI